MKKWVKYQLDHKELTLPFLIKPCTQILNCSVNDLIHNSSLQAQGMYEISKRYPMSASLGIMDLSVEAEEFGAEVKYYNDEVPIIDSPMIANIEEVEKLIVPKVGTKRTKVYIEGIKKAKELIIDRPIFSNVTGPFTVCSLLIGLNINSINGESEKFIHIILNKVTEFLINYVLAFKEAGVDGVVISEPFAGFLSLKLCDEFSSKYVKKIKEAVDDENFIFIYHNCGNVIPILDSIISIGADIYHFGNAIDIHEVLKKVGSDIVVMGNIDPILFKCGTKKSITNEVNRLFNENANYPNYIISSGCDIPATSKNENIQSYFDAIRANYKKQKL